MKNKINYINIEKIAELFGTDVYGLGERCRSFYETLDMSYEPIEGEEKERLILDILKKIDSDEQIIGAAERTAAWQNGWQENLDDFRKEKNKQSIVPKFIRPDKIVRFDKQFIRPNNKYFEKDYTTLLQLYVYHRVISKNIENVYEFGAGSGYNLINLMDYNPNLNLYGSDFVQSSVDLINEMGHHYDTNLKAEVFNMIEPDYNYEIKPNSCIFTHGAVEQLASQVKNIINFFVHKKPEICFHIEPTVEFYDNNDLFDYLQTKFHRKRGYSTGLVPYLLELQDQGKIEIKECRRLFFGSKFMEGYNLVIWKPIQTL
jgi:hypothetical protein